MDAGDASNFSKVKVFTATMARERESLGEKVTEWIEKNHPSIVDTVVTQSSDEAFHCLTLTVFYN